MMKYFLIALLFFASCKREANPKQIIYVGGTCPAGNNKEAEARYERIADSLLGLDDVNVGNSGTTLGKPADSCKSMIDNLKDIPTCTHTPKYIIYE